MYQVYYTLESLMKSVVTVLLVSAPILGAALLTGLIISILQATTQIQETDPGICSQNCSGVAGSDYFRSLDAECSY